MPPMPSFQSESTDHDFDSQLTTKLDELKGFVLAHHQLLVAHLPEQDPGASAESPRSSSGITIAPDAVQLDLPIGPRQTSGSVGRTVTRRSRDTTANITLSRSSTCFLAGVGFRIKHVWGKIRESGNDQQLAVLHAHATSHGDDFNVEGALILNEEGQRVRVSQHTQGPLLQKKRCHSSIVMVDPTSPPRLLWVMISLGFLAYDFFMVPLEASFNMKSNTFNESLKHVTSVFWTLDIVMTCCTGIYVDGCLVMDLWLSAMLYARTWLAFDVLLVGSEWALLIVKETSGESVSGGSLVSLFRGARSARIMKLLRFFRLARILKVRALLKQVLEMTVEGLQVTLTLATIIVSVVAMMHFGACIWAAIGSADGGWVVASGMNQNQVHDVYAVALQWMLLSIQGTRVPRATVEATGEIMVDNLILLLSLTMMCCITASVTQIGLTWASSDTLRLHRMAERYLKAHEISKRMKQKTHRFLRTHGLDGPGELVHYETQLFRALPLYLQEDLHYEARAPLLCMNRGFLTLHSLTPRCVRSLCDRLLDQVTVQGESVFVRGQACQQMYIVRAGVLTYRCEEFRLSQSPRYCKFPRDAESAPDTDLLARGQPISEACLWTDWEHSGKLEALKHDGLLTVLVAADFADVCSQSRVSRVYGFRYAYHYVGRLNRCMSCDITGFDMDIGDVSEDTHTGTHEDHFIFLSHYKIESGTEAILLRDLLLKSITSDVNNTAFDLMSPVFLDTEDLEDLDQLVAHVECSSNILTFLTPNYLSRPWCLLEIVTAVRAGIHVIPVLIQRPAMEYEFPDDAWYSSLRSGGTISKKGIEMLNKRGISVEEVESCIRTVFKQIALPFSPQKSNTIRDAEVADILKRCATFETRSIQYKSRSATKLLDPELSPNCLRILCEENGSLMPLWGSEVSL